MTVRDLRCKIAEVPGGRAVASLFDDSEDELRDDDVIGELCSRGVATVFAVEAADHRALVLCESLGPGCADADFEELCASRPAACQRICLSGCTRLSQSALACLPDFLQELSLSGCGFGESFVEPLAALVEETRCRAIPQMSYSAMTATNPSRLYAHPCSALVLLNLAGNHLGASCEGMATFASALSSNRCFCDLVARSSFDREVRCTLQDPGHIGCVFKPAVFTTSRLGEFNIIATGEILQLERNPSVCRHPAGGARHSAHRPGPGQELAADGAEHCRQRCPPGGRGRICSCA
jgi:hypothetical protein